MKTQDGTLDGWLEGNDSIWNEILLKKMRIFPLHSSLNHLILASQYRVCSANEADYDGDCETVFSNGVCYNM